MDTKFGEEVMLIKKNKMKDHFVRSGIIFKVML